jgi:hypothetical protein
MKLRIASSSVLASLMLAGALTTAAYAADPTTPNLNVLGSVKVVASPGDTIFAAKNHHHEYVYVAHARDKAVDVIDVSDPSAPHQLTGHDAVRARRMGQTAVISVPETPTTTTARVLDISDPAEPRVVAEFPNAISATSDSRKLIYVLDENSLRVLDKAQSQPQGQDETDRWFRNATAGG